MGLRSLSIVVEQAGREIPVFEKNFPYQGVLNRDGSARFQTEFIINPHLLKLAQGQIDIHARVRDYSRRGGGDGNMALVHHKTIIDTVPPSLRAISRLHNINHGGTGLILYQVSSDIKKSGVHVGDLFFTGYPVQNSQKNVFLCYFAIPHDADLSPSIYLWAEDRAGNQSKTTFYHHIRRKRFRQDTIHVSDSFLNRILPYFSSYLGDGDQSDVEKYIRVNNDLREENHRTIQELCRKTSKDRLWEGSWQSLKNAAAMARFGDRRTYYYGKEKIDEKVHLGVDLASLANSPVPAANHGIVIFAGQLGIYGQTVVLDHGQGLGSLYGHLSKIEVTKDQTVRKGDRIGYTGQTGLAGGDHLHFSVMVHGTFTNPIEWWDDHWIKDNIDKKLALLED
jgi:hypothetical protein